MILAQLNSGTAGTLSTVGAMVVTLIIKDLIRDRYSKSREAVKVDELSKQTAFLQDLVDLAKRGQKAERKTNKKILRQLKSIHGDVLVVKAQTTKGNDR